MYSLVIIALMVTNPFSSSNSDTVAATAVKGFANEALCNQAAGRVRENLKSDTITTVCVQTN